MKYVQIDQDGFPLAFYSSDVYSVMPSDALAITDEQWMECLENQGRRKLVDGVLLEYTPPLIPDPVPATISDRQFYQQLAVEGIITQEEALASCTGVVPQALLDILSSMPIETQFGAKMLLSGATVFERSHPMTEVIGAAYGWTSEQIDDFWRAASIL